MSTQDLYLHFPFKIVVFLIAIIIIIIIIIIIKNKRGDIEKWDQTGSLVIPDSVETSEIPCLPSGGADGKMESNDSPEMPDRGETSEDPGLPSGQKNGIKCLMDDFESIKYR